jgi:uncharacterized protein (TIGR02217 family)
MSYPVMNTAVPWSLVKGGFHKTPHFNSSVIMTAARRGCGSVGYQPYATWDFSIDLNLVLGGESIQYSVLQQFIGCFLATMGRGGLFLFTDPNDNAVDDTGCDTPQSLLIASPNGLFNPAQTTGDGVTTQFQLARIIDQGVDILQNTSNWTMYVNDMPAVDGSGAATFTVESETGIVTFNTAPPSGAKLTWSGNFQYLCRFTEDTLKDLSRTAKNSAGWLWSCGSVSFESEFV